MFFIVHEELFYKDCRAQVIPKHIEVFFTVLISVAGIVGADYLDLEDLLCSFIEAVSESV